MNLFFLKDMYLCTKESIMHHPEIAITHWPDYICLQLPDRSGNGTCLCGRRKMGRQPDQWSVSYTHLQHQWHLIKQTDQMALRWEDQAECAEEKKFAFSVAIRTALSITRTLTTVSYTHLLKESFKGSCKDRKEGTLYWYRRSGR